MGCKSCLRETHEALVRSHKYTTHPTSIAQDTGSLARSPLNGPHTTYRKLQHKSLVSTERNEDEYTCPIAWPAPAAASNGAPGRACHDITQNNTSICVWRPTGLLCRAAQILLKPPPALRPLPAANNNLPSCQRWVLTLLPVEKRPQ